MRGRAAVVASGGFESNLEWLREIWGEAADNFIVRGTPYNTGTLLRLLLDAGAQPVGDPHACHAIAVDARAPKFDGGIVTRLDSVPFGIVVNSDGERFYDEGEDVWPKRYAIWGGLIARQPGQIAYSIVDASRDRAVHAVGVSADRRRLDPGARRRSSGCRPATLEATVEAFNRAVRPGACDYARARRLPHRRPAAGQDALGAAPRHAAVLWPIRFAPGITFTYLGVRVDERARVLMARRRRRAATSVPPARSWRATSCGRGYIAGIGMTIGTVFGRIAGEEAAPHAASMICCGAART